MTLGDGPIPYGRQAVDEADIAAVTKVLRGDWLTQGPTVDRFEKAVADRVEAKHAVAYANGTAALHGACFAAGLGPGDLVQTTALSFIGSANCARYVGADVDLVDIDPDTLNMNLDSVRADAECLVAVHFAGLPVALSQLSSRPRVIIEDAAHALGAWTPDGPVGNCAHSDLTCFSFHPVKPITTGEGGLVTTNDDAFAERLRVFRTHGIVKNPTLGGWHYTVPEIGYNYRLSDIHSALGLSQMGKLDAYIERRQELAARYDELLAPLPLTRAPQAPAGWGHGYHIYPIRVAERRSVYDELRERGVNTQVHYVPIHHHPPYSDLGPYPNTDAAYDGLLSLPLFPTLTNEQQGYVVDQLADILS